jgi:hypothetical protein
MQKKLGMPKSTVRHNAQIGKYSISAKKAQFGPSTHIINAASFWKILSTKEGELRFLRNQ